MGYSLQTPGLDYLKSFAGLKDTLERLNIIDVFECKLGAREASLGGRGGGYLSEKANSLRSLLPK